MRKLGLFIISILAISAIVAFNKAPIPPKQPTNGKIEWLSYEQALEQMESNQKKMLVFVYTDWANWCKHMDNTTFKDEHIADYINQHFYAVKLDAEYPEDIKTIDKTYSLVKGNDGKNYHELAIELTMGRLELPTCVFLDETTKILQPISGFKNAKEFEMMVTYYGDDNYKKLPWSLYQKSYIPLNEQGMQPTLIKNK